MPHDRNGRPLAKGDRVVIEGTLIGVSPGNDYCNVTVETVEPMHPGKHRATISLNARQVIRDDREAVPESERRTVVDTEERWTTADAPASQPADSAR